MGKNRTTDSCNRSFLFYEQSLQFAKTGRLKMSLRPFVYWAQTETDLFLKVDVKKVQGEPDVVIEEEEIEFTAKGIGSQGEGLVQRYHFVIEFFLPIDPSRSQVDV